MPETAREVLENLYAATTDNGHARDVLDELCIDADYAWECPGTLTDDADLPCGYVNVPLLHGKPYDAPCSNCGEKRPDYA